MNYVGCLIYDGLIGEGFGTYDKVIRTEEGSFPPSLKPQSETNAQYLQASHTNQHNPTA